MPSRSSFEAVIAPWVERTGVTVNYESTRDINATLTTRIEGGNPPDVAGLPGPGATGSSRAAAMSYRSRT